MNIDLPLAFTILVRAAILAYVVLDGYDLGVSVVPTALYLSVTAMLIGLTLRGVAFEFRVKAEGWHREFWNALFWFGSFLGALVVLPFIAA